MASDAAVVPDVERRVQLALAMIDMGAAVFPLSPGAKTPLIPKRKGGGGFLDAHRDPELASTFLRQGGRPNYGVVFPEGSDIVVLDLDGGERDKRPGWQADWQRLYERLGPPGLTFIVRTPSGGRHAYYRWRTDLYGEIPPGDEMLGWTVRKPWKGYLVGPGSIVSDAVYEPVGSAAIADLPEPWARAAIAEKTERHQPDDAITFSSRGPAQVQSGHRHAYLRDQARHLRGVGLAGEALFAAVMDLNRQLPEPKSADEVRKAIGDVEARFEPDAIDPATGLPDRSAQTRGGVGRKKVRTPEVIDDLPFYTASQVAAMTPEIVDWAWRDYLAYGTIVEVVGPPKAGKTTLVFGMVRSYVERRAFLDRPTTGGSVLILSEQGSTSLRAVLARCGLTDRDDVEVLFHRDVRGHEWPDVVATAVQRCRDLNARLLVVDTLPAFAGLSGESENNSGDALEAMEPLLAAAAEGLAVLVNRHRRKSLPGAGAGDVADEGRGSGAFSGAVDVILSLRRKAGGGRPTIRVLVAASRFDETPEELTIELVDGRYIALSEDAALESDVARGAVLMLLDDHPDGLTLGELEEALSKSRVTLQRALNDLEHTHDVVRHGRGIKGDPHRWRRSDAIPDSAQFDSAQGPGILSAQTLTYSVGEMNEGPGREEVPVSQRDGSAGVICHFYRDHQGVHHRGPDGAYHCRICSPCDVSSGCSMCLEEGA